MGKSPTDKSTLKSGAAKKDFVGDDGDFTFSINDLLANDPGGANKNGNFFFGDTAADQANQAAYLTAHHIVKISDADGGTYQIGVGATDFNYFVQIGNNGTWSTAEVDVTAPPAPHGCDHTPHLSGNELLNNWNFEQDNANNASGFVSVDHVAGWTNEAGGSSPMEVQHQSLGFVAGFAAGEKQWLDTSASPGNIHIGQDIDIGTGVHAQLSVRVAAENIVYNNGYSINTYQPDADDHLLFKLNGDVVKDIKLADFSDGQGHVDWNHFKDFTVDVTGKAGTDHFEIQSTGMDQYTDGNGVIHGYAGFAVDHVSLQQWTTDGCATAHAGAELFVENFDGYTDAPQFGVVDLGAKSGWTNAGHSELAANGYGNIVSTSGGFWFDTQNSPGAVDVSHTFTDPTGGKAQLSFDVATESLDYQGQHYATDPNGAFQFKVDGHVVAQYTTAQLNGLGGENHMLHFDVQFDTGAAGSQHTLELVDLSAPGLTGFAVDSIRVNDWIV